MSNQHQSRFNSVTNRQLKIGIDVRTLETPEAQRRGFGRYISNLVSHMARRAPQHQFILYGEQFPWAVPHLQTLVERSNVRYVTYHPSFHRKLNVFLLTEPLSLRANHRLFAMPPGDVPCATILYDLIPLAYEREYLPQGSVMRRQFFDNLQVLQQSVTQYLAISEFVAEDLQARLGVSENCVHAIGGGLDEVFQQPPSAQDVRNTLAKFDLRPPYFVYAGGTDFRKNLSALLEAFRILVESSAEHVTLVLAGEMDALTKQSLLENRFGEKYSNALRPLGYVTDDELRALYGGATALVFPSLYEGFGLPALEAMASNCPVIAANGSALREVVGDAGLLIDPLQPSEIATAMAQLLTDNSNANELRKRGLMRAASFTWDAVAAKALTALERMAQPGTKMTALSRRLRVSIQNRESAFVAPGGDTVVMEQLYRSLRARDVEADVSAPGGDLANFDLVHLVNLTVRDMPRTVAQNAARRGLPLAITTLYEDWPRHMERSVRSWSLFKEYLERGKDERFFAKGLVELRRIQDDSHVGKEDVVAAAALLFACGDTEAANLRVAYPGCDRKIHIAKFGSQKCEEITPAGLEKVRELLGFDRYLVCCGRLETRKNQLMLLKALDDLDLPIVLAAGGFTYQPSYAKLVHEWPRLAPVKIIGRTTSVFLSYLMGGALVHVLPSWYELPGLVTLEAASAGTAVVASDWGAIRDYLPEDVAHYCQPDDPDSIRSAVEQALRAGPNPKAKALADSYTWEAFGDATLAAYEALLSKTIAPGKSHSQETLQQLNTRAEGSMNTSKPEPASFDASIIIPVYPDSSNIQENLEAICSATDGIEYEVILVDNGTPEEITRILHAVEGDVAIVRVSQPLSFVAACQHGARLARGEHLVFLNADSAVQTGWLDALLACAQQESALGVVGMKCLNENGTMLSAGIVFDEKREPKRAFAELNADHPGTTETREMQAVPLNGSLVRRSAYTDAQFSEEWTSDVLAGADLCLSLKQSGWVTKYCATGTMVVHRPTDLAAADADELRCFQERWGTSVLADERDMAIRYGLLRSPQGSPSAHQPFKPFITLGEETSTATVQSADTLFSKANALYTAGKLEEAAATLQNIVEKRMVLAGEDSFEVWQTLGNCLARLNQLEEAEKAYYEAMRADDASERPYLGLGSVAMLQENWQAAMYSFMMALAKNPDTTKGEFGVGLAMAARKMHNEALNHFERVLTKDPENREVLFHFYRSAMEAGEPERSIPALENHLHTHPADTAFLFNLCGACWKAGQITRAADLCLQVIEREPKNVAAQEVLKHLQVSVEAHA
jgi:glycosyltransferase involved in cell wall biosynthesis/tetratricopeptide (TPR) repeat protein